MKLAWRKKTGAGSSSQLVGRPLRGVSTAPSSMLKGKLAFLRASIDGTAASWVRSFTIRGLVLSEGMILESPVLPSATPSLMTCPASHGKLTNSRSRPLVNVSIIWDWEEASCNGKQRQMGVYNLSLIR